MNEDDRDEQIDWAWLIEDCDNENERAALEAERDAEVDAEAQRRIDDEWEMLRRLEYVVEYDERDIPF